MDLICVLLLPVLVYRYRTPARLVPGPRRNRRLRRTRRPNKSRGKIIVSVTVTAIRRSTCTTRSTRVSPPSRNSAYTRQCKPGRMWPISISASSQTVRTERSVSATTLAATGELPTCLMAARPVHRPRSAPGEVRVRLRWAVTFRSRLFMKSVTPSAYNIRETITAAAPTTKTARSMRRTPRHAP